MSHPESLGEIARFRDHIIEGGVLDAEGTHHEFVSGMHGQKLDFDIIKNEDPLYQEWITATANFIRRELRLPEVIIGVANGTNRVALDVARRFNGDVLGLVSEKDQQNSKILRLSSAAERVFGLMRPEFVVVKEDVGTTGSNSVQVATQALEAGAQHVLVLATWKRRAQLERLDEAGIDYAAMIDEPLTTYTPEECTAEGFCADGWKFIPRTT